MVIIMLCYKLISPCFQGHETTVEIELGGEKFSAQGLMILAKNYLEVYIYDSWNAKVDIFCLVLFTSIQSNLAR